MKILQLFWAFIQIGFYSFGGGYATLPHIQTIIVEQYGWITMTEYVDIVTISQMTPGPIAINAATFVGTKSAGILGAIAATLGSVIPSTIICLLLAWIYLKYKNLSVVKGILSGLRPAVVSLIAIAGIGILQTAFFHDSTQAFLATNINYVGIVLFAISIFLIRSKWKIGPIVIMIGAGILNLVIQLFV